MIFLVTSCRFLYDFRRTPAISGLPMQHRLRPDEQDDLLRPRLTDMIGLQHELATLVDGEVFEPEWSGFFPSGKGRPATQPRQGAGLLYTGRILCNLRHQKEDMPEGKLQDRITAKLALVSHVLHQQPRRTTRSAPCMSQRSTVSPRARRWFDMSLAARSAWSPRWARASWSAGAAFRAILSTATPCARRWNMWKS